MTMTDVQPDAAALRQVRRSRVLDEMEAADIDVLVLGREANARYVAGVRRLWTAGSRPFAPSCVLVRETGAIHLLSTWDEGIPDDIPHENLYGITFNPMNLVEVLKGIDGAATAKRIATDALTPMFAQLLPMAFPAAEIVDGEGAMRRARSVKLPAEVEALRASIRVAERGLAAAEADLQPGASERRLTGAFMEAMALAGVTTPSTQDVAWVTSRDRPWGRGDRDAAINDGELVVFDAGVISDGYVGELGRTNVAGDATAAHAELFGRGDELLGRLLDACRPGAPSSVLLGAYTTMQLEPPPVPIARGLGLGFDLPLVTPDLPETAAAQLIEVGMVLVLTAYVWQSGVGGVSVHEPVLVTADGPESLASEPAIA